MKWRIPGDPTTTRLIGDFGFLLFFKHIYTKCYIAITVANGIKGQEKKILKTGQPLQFEKRYTADSFKPSLYRDPVHVSSENREREQTVPNQQGSEV